jgi:hypothetical protein
VLLHWLRQQFASALAVPAAMRLLAGPMFPPVKAAAAVL